MSSNLGSYPFAADLIHARHHRIDSGATAHDFDTVMLHMNAGREGDRQSAGAPSGRKPMPWLHYVSYFFGGVFFANAVPHLVSGMMGRAFQSPFAKPPGKGLSSSTVNVLWGAFNVAVGYGLIIHVGAFDLHDPAKAGVAGAGALLVSLHSARHFGQFHGGNSNGVAESA